MKLFSKFAYHASAYTVLITMLFFAFAKISGLETSPSVTFGRYALIFAFGLVLSAAEYIFSIDKLNRSLKYALHYVTLAIAFFFVFLTVRSSEDSFAFNAATIFASLIIFSVVYFVMLGLYLLFKSAFKSNKSAKETKSPKKNKKVK